MSPPNGSQAASAACEQTLDVLDAAIAAKQVELDRLTTARDAMRAFLGKAQAAPAVQPAAAQPRTDEPNRVRFARALLAHGPMSGNDLAQVVGLNLGSTSVLYRNPWFRRSGSNRSDPWEVTEQGRKELAAWEAEEGVQPH